MQLIDTIKYLVWWWQKTKKVDFTFDFNLLWINQPTCIGYSRSSLVGGASSLYYKLL